MHPQNCMAPDRSWQRRNQLSDARLNRLQAHPYPGMLLVRMYRPLVPLDGTPCSQPPTFILPGTGIASNYTATQIDYDKVPCAPLDPGSSAPAGDASEGEEPLELLSFLPPLSVEGAGRDSTTAMSTVMSSSLPPCKPRAGSPGMHHKRQHQASALLAL